MILQRIFLLLTGLYLFIFSTVLLAKPQRIVSLNLCADQILMELLPPHRLVGVTNMAGDPEISFAHQKAQNYHAHSGRVEEIIALKPDLIIAGQFTSSASNQLLESLGYPLIKIGLPHSMADVFEQIERIGKKVDATEPAEKLLGNLKQRLSILNQEKRLAPLPRAIVYYANGYSAGKKTIVNEILNVAGFSNIAAEEGLIGVAPFSLERLIASKPDALILGKLSDNELSLAHHLLQHKAIQKMTNVGQVKKIMVADRLWNCAGPSNIAAVEYLRKIP